MTIRRTIGAEPLPYLMRDLEYNRKSNEAVTSHFQEQQYDFRVSSIPRSGRVLISGAT